MSASNEAMLDQVSGVAEDASFSGMPGWHIHVRNVLNCSLMRITTSIALHARSFNTPYRALSAAANVAEYSC